MSCEAWSFAALPMQSAGLAASVMSSRWQCSAALGGPVWKQLSSSSYQTALVTKDLILGPITWKS